MQMEFQQSESVAVRRRWILVLVDSTDGVTGKTGQTGTVQISVNGSTPATSTNSIVEVDSVNMPGHYYIELTAAELGTLGMISIYYKASGTLAFHDRGFVTYDDPFTRQGGFAVGGSSSTSSLTKAQAADLLKNIRAIVREELKVVDKEIPEPVDYTEKLDNILSVLSQEKEIEDIDFTPVLTAINSIEKPKDYSDELAGLSKRINELGKIRNVDMSTVNTALQALDSNLKGVNTNLKGSVDQIAKLKLGLTDLNKLMDEFSTTLSEQTDMDKRFNSMNNAMFGANNNTKLESLSKKITELAVEITNMRFDIKEAALK